MRRASQSRRPGVTALLGLGVLLCALAAGAAPDKPAKQDGQEEVDHLALAALLIKDGHYSRAAGVLAEVDRAAEGLDLPRFYLLLGLVELESDRHAPAAEAFEQSVAAGQTDPMVHVFLAQARFGLEDFRGVVSALDEAGAAAHDLPGSFLLRAQAHWRLGERIAAWQALDDGLRRHPEMVELARHKVLLLVDLGLFQQAREEGATLLARPDTRAGDFLAIAEALRKGGQVDQAALVLEEAHLRLPASEDILILLARCYLDLDLPLAAAGLFREAARLNPEKYTADAAELYRRAGHLIRALALNAQVAEQEAKIRQRLGLLIELERFEEAASLAPRLSRLGLLEDENIGYALAYAYFRTGQYRRAEQRLQGLRDADLFRKGIELRKAMETCERSGWLCE